MRAMTMNNKHISPGQQSQEWIEAGSTVEVLLTWRQPVMADYSCTRLWSSSPVPVLPLHWQRCLLAVSRLGLLYVWCLRSGRCWRAWWCQGKWPQPRKCRPWNRNDRCCCCIRSHCCCCIHCFVRWSQRRSWKRWPRMPLSAIWTFYASLKESRGTM